MVCERNGPGMEQKEQHQGDGGPDSGGGGPRPRLCRSGGRQGPRHFHFSLASSRIPKTRDRSWRSLPGGGCQVRRHPTARASVNLQLEEQEILRLRRFLDALATAFFQDYWAQVGMPLGPVHYGSLLSGCRQIREKLGIPCGLAFSPTMEGNVTLHTILYS